MQRRSIMAGATTGLAALGTLTTPALAQTAPAIRWRMATSWPNSLDALQGSAVNLCKRVGQLTDGRFEIRCFAGGELMPALQVMDAVQSGTIECGHVMSSNFIGKNPAFAFDAGLPFGMNIRQQAAWLHDGGGLELMRALYRQTNLIPFPAGNTGAQMGGFFRKEIRGPEDLRGLKMRIPGLGGSVMAKLGAVPQQIPGSEVYAALERGTIDAAEWIGPYDDEKIGLHKVAPYYYAPGWWDTNATMSVQVSLPAWEALVPNFKAAFEVACNEQFMLMPTRYDARNPDALRRMLAQGVQLRIFPRAVMEACYKAAFETYDELAQSSQDFRTIYGPWKRFLESSNPWFRVAEGNMDTFRFSHEIPG